MEYVDFGPFKAAQCLLSTDKLPTYSSNNSSTSSPAVQAQSQSQSPSQADQQAAQMSPMLIQYLGETKKEEPFTGVAVISNADQAAAGTSQQ